MKINILGSSSKGNCYVLHNNEEALIIEAGVSFDKVIKSIDFKVNNIVGVACSHVHS